jgi:hypothetical protein
MSLVNERNNLGKTITEYKIEVNMTLRCTDNEENLKAKSKEDIPPKCTKFDLRRIAPVAIHYFSPLFLPAGHGFQAQEILPR